MTWGKFGILWGLVLVGVGTVKRLFMDEDDS